jgi:hypothetical protein
LLRFEEIAIKEREQLSRIISECKHYFSRGFIALVSGNSLAMPTIYLSLIPNLPTALKPLYPFYEYASLYPSYEYIYNLLLFLTSLMPLMFLVKRGTLPFWPPELRISVLTQNLVLNSRLLKICFSLSLHPQVPTGSLHLTYVLLRYFAWVKEVAKLAGSLMTLLASNKVNEIHSHKRTDRRGFKKS